MNDAKQFYIGFAKRFGVLLQHDAESNQIKVLYSRALSPTALAEIRRFCAQPVTWHQIDDNEFNRKLVAAYETASSEAMQMVEDLEGDLDLFRAAEALKHSEDLLESQDDAPIIRLINAILSEAIKAEASDVHIETFEDNLSVRFRVDGVLRKVLEPQRLLAPLLISRIKVMAKLDIAEKRLPQDGRITLRIGGRTLDVRVSTMPASHGERVVLRLLEKNADKLDLSNLGLSDEALTALEALIHKPYGIILVTGPTGAGKTTTLYAALSVLNESTRNILTVEDPVEYDLPGIGQTQINSKVEMTFAKGLRAILRQDPDVVMIGEIRDLETADIAVQASLTGHLVLSTLHTNTAIGAITRLQDMGVEKFLLSTSLVGVVAQRLVRVLCAQCKVSKLASSSECALLEANVAKPPTLYEPSGCEACNQTGYAGRVGVYEIVAVDETLREMINDDSSEMLMARYARQTLPSIRRDGISRVLSGQTSLEEILRVTTED